MNTPRDMPYTRTYKIATININGISSHVRIKMLEDYLRQQDIDIVLLQGRKPKSPHSRDTMHMLTLAQKIEAPPF